MADPGTLMLAAAGVQALSSISQGQAAKSAADYNAGIARQNAAAVMQQAQQDAQLQQIQAQQTSGKISASYGASGVDMSGSALDVLANSASTAEMDRQTILYKARLQQAGYQDEASLDTAKGANAQTAGYVGAVGALTGGAAKAAYYSGSNLGGDSSTKPAYDGFQDDFG